MTLQELKTLEVELSKRGYKKRTTCLTSTETYAWFKTFGKEKDEDGEVINGYQIAFRVWDWRQYMYRDKNMPPYGFDFCTSPLFVSDGSDAFMVKFNSMSQRGKYVPPSIDEPCPTVAVQNRLGVAQVAFLSKQFSGSPEDKNITIDGPAGAITCVDHHALVSAQFLTMFYGTSTATSIDEPCGCVTTNPKHSLVTVRKHFLVNPQYNSAGRSIDEPCFTLIARMDKRPPCLVSTESGEIAIEVYETDSPMMIKIKEFMAKYGLADIYMRMLKVVELKRIQGFPDDYVLMGNQSDQKKFIGNAVHTCIPKAWCPALCLALQESPTQIIDNVQEKGNRTARIA